VLIQHQRMAEITCIFVDIGGVLLTNGWDHRERKRVARHFELNYAEMDARHRLNFEIHEEGRITFREYIDRIVFYTKRPFTRAEFRSYMCEQSKPFPKMIALLAQLKTELGLKIAVVSNESRELNAYRTRKFKLGAIVDCFVSSCFVHLRKPDIDIFKLALDLASTPASRVLYIDNTPLFLQIAERLGIRTILHTDYNSTLAQLATFGISNANTE
jgi:putative hydrolase of the HAD superfamily